MAESVAVPRSVPYRAHPRVTRRVDQDGDVGGAEPRVDAGQDARAARRLSAIEKSTRGDCSTLPVA